MSRERGELSATYQRNSVKSDLENAVPRGTAGGGTREAGTTEAGTTEAGTTEAGSREQANMV